MASPRPEGEKAVLLVGILAADRAALRAAADELECEFGPSCLGMPPVPFDSSSYYAEELGPEPSRTFLVFPERLRQDRLPGIKLATNRMEMELAVRLGGPWSRPVNLDPGYLTLAKLVLASAKNFSHRVYLADGIYGEVTLMYRGGEYRTLPWTFPDYGSGAYFPFFLAARRLLLE